MPSSLSKDSRASVAVHGAAHTIKSKRSNTRLMIARLSPWHSPYTRLERAWKMPKTVFLLIVNVHSTMKYADIGSWRDRDTQHLTDAYILGTTSARTGRRSNSTQYEKQSRSRDLSSTSPIYMCALATLFVRLVVFLVLFQEMPWHHTACFAWSLGGLNTRSASLRFRSPLRRLLHPFPLFNDLLKYCTRNQDEAALQLQRHQLRTAPNIHRRCKDHGLTGAVGACGG